MDKEIKVKVSGTWWICFWLGLILIVLNGIYVRVARIEEGMNSTNVESKTTLNAENK